VLLPHSRQLLARIRHLRSAEERAPSTPSTSILQDRNLAEREGAARRRSRRPCSGTKKSSATS
jgi:hypothetical protein